MLTEIVMSTIEFLMFFSFMLYVINYMTDNNLKILMKQSIDIIL